MPKFVSVKMQVQTHSDPTRLKKWLQDLVDTKGDKIKIIEVEDTGTSWSSDKK